MLERLRGGERRTRPADPAFAAALARRWAELPEAARTPGQVLGRFGPGCGFVVGGRWHPVLDGHDPRDLAARAAIFRYFAGIGFAVTPLPLLVVKLLRLGARPLTFVMHRFMDAADVAPAWELSEQGVTADDPRLRETQERLAACHYAMAHPETGTLVPACVQHSVLDPAENARLAVELPMPTVRRSGVRR